MAYRVFGLAAVSITACQEPDSSGTWSGEYVLLTSTQGVEPCAGTLSFLDDYILHTHEYWGSQATSERLELELRDGGEEPQAGGARIGSAWAGAEYAVLHELNHLVTNTEDGYSAPSLTEGIATALAPSDPFAMWGNTAESPEDFAFLKHGDFGSGDYDSASQLSRFLIQRYGIGSFRQAYQEADRSASPAEIEEAYISAFGDEVYSAFDEFDESTRCGLRAWECERSLSPTMALPIDLVSPMDCTQDADWIGAAGTLNQRWYPHRRILVELSDEIQIITRGDNARVVRITCDDSCGSRLGEPPQIDNVSPPPGFGDMAPSTLGAGLHSFQISPIDPSLPFSVRIEQYE